MSMMQGVKKQSLASQLFFGLANMFTKDIKLSPPTLSHRGKHRGKGKAQASGSKIVRAIKRGNHGLVNKHGTIAASIAEEKRVNWLMERGKPVVRLSTSL